MEMEKLLILEKKTTLNHWEILVLKISIFFPPEYTYAQTQKNPLGLAYKSEWTQRGWPVLTALWSRSGLFPQACDLWPPQEKGHLLSSALMIHLTPLSSVSLWHAFPLAQDRLCCC